jgi:hypothetical protein
VGVEERAGQIWIGFEPKYRPLFRKTRGTRLAKKQMLELGHQSVVQQYWVRKLSVLGSVFTPEHTGVWRGRELAYLERQEQQCKKGFHV